MGRRSHDFGLLFLAILTLHFVFVPLVALEAKEIPSKDHFPQSTPAIPSPRSHLDGDPAGIWDSPIILASDET